MFFLATVLCSTREVFANKKYKIYKCSRSLYDILKMIALPRLRHANSADIADFFGIKF